MEGEFTKMIKITHKSNTLRTAIAKATLAVGSAETIVAIKNNQVPKGNVIEAARVAGLFAAKSTSSVIPDCHPLPIEFTAVRFEIHDFSIDIEVEIHTIYKTGVEVEAMHAASIVALTMYDMLKPIDKQISIQNIHLVKKTGGKSAKKYPVKSEIQCAIVVCSDSISGGSKTDKAGLIIQEKLEGFGLDASNYSIIPDEISVLQEKVMNLKGNGVQLVIITGGTGVSPRDTSPEAIVPLIERRMPGIEETIRNYGQQRTPYAMLSRSVVGFIGETLIMVLPGSTNGASESIDAVFPAVLHIFDVLKAFRHD